MTIFNRRNAMIGWATWVVGKRIFKSRAAGGGRKKKSIAAAAAAGVAAVGGALLVWRKRKSHDEQPTSA
jgi:hypothetical protein